METEPGDGVPVSDGALVSRGDGKASICSVTPLPPFLYSMGPETREYALSHTEHE